MHALGKIAAVTANLAVALAQSSISVNYNSELQTIDGFGVSQAFTRAGEFEAMASTPRQQGLDYLFSTTTGAGLSIIRNRIGSGGTGDSILPTNPGGPNASPNYVWDGSDSSQVWFSKEAMKYGVSTIYADAWSAPGFMKTSGSESNGGWLCGVTGHTCSSGDWRQAFANMLAQYVKFYAQEGITVTHLGFLNEPDYVVSYSSMQSTGTEAASFIPILYETMQSEGLGDVKLTCCDGLGWSSQARMTAELVAAGMERYLGVITSHMYSGDATYPMSTSLPTWITEACDLNSAWCTTWYSNGGLCEGMTWATKIAQGVVNADLSAYIYWEGVEVNQFQASSYLVASDGTEVIPSGRLWAFAMWSRFVRPGAKRLSTSGSMSNVIYGAFKNTDGSVAVVFTNTGGSSQSARVSFSGFTPGSADAYLTDNSHSVASTGVTLSGGAATISIPAHSVVTVKLTSGGSGSGTSSGSSTSTSTSTSSSTSSQVSTPTSSSGTSQPSGSSSCTSAHWAQCGGTGFTGCTTCGSPYTCTYLNQWYSQCL